MHIVLISSHDGAHIVYISCSISLNIILYRTYRTAVQLADELTFTKELPLEWLSTAMYEKASRMLDRHQSGKFPQYHRVSDSEYLVLTTYGVNEFKKVTPKLIERYHQRIEYISHHITFISLTYRLHSCCIRFEKCYAGILPKSIKSFKQLAEVCNSLVKVRASTVLGSCIPCQANPFEFLCGCKNGRKTGCCSHILVVTHAEMKNSPKERRRAICNLKYMTVKIAGGKKKVGGRHTVKHCLVREDSSDDDDVKELALKW